MFFVASLDFMLPSHPNQSSQEWPWAPGDRSLVLESASRIRGLCAAERAAGGTAGRLTGPLARRGPWSRLLVVGPQVDTSPSTSGLVVFLGLWARPSEQSPGVDTAKWGCQSSDPATSEGHRALSCHVSLRNHRHLICSSAESVCP